ncbi:hypothetical protein Sjap_021936 [Stephania japonica]|uniref:Uncharacterized protein n=1 Tax=Stephania japonica TaxID=461633 RepID=A0AAP0ENB7_9MAGN
MIRKFAFDFYMSIPIWMSNIEEVVKVICMFMKHRELHPSHFCARRMTKVFKRWMIPEGYCWKSHRLIIKTNTARQWKIFFRWDDALPEDLVRAAYDKACRCTRYTALMHKLKKNRIGSRATSSRPSYTEQSVDDEAVYLNVADAGCGAAARVRCRCGATTKGYELHASRSWDGHGRNRPSSRTTTTTATPPPPPHDQSNVPPQIDPADPPQQGDNVGRETTPCLGGRRGGYSGGKVSLVGVMEALGPGLGAYREALHLFSSTSSTSSSSSSSGSLTPSKDRNRLLRLRLRLLRFIFRLNGSLKTGKGCLMYRLMGRNNLTNLIYSGNDAATNYRELVFSRVRKMKLLTCQWLRARKPPRVPSRNAHEIFQVFALVQGTHQADRKIQGASVKEERPSILSLSLVDYYGGKEYIIQDKIAETESEMDTMYSVSDSVSDSVAD